jgi:hypothetical protein
VPFKPTKDSKGKREIAIKPVLGFLKILGGQVGEEFSESRRCI